MDLKLKLGELNQIDLGFASNDIETDDGLETAVMLSLFTDQRVETSDLPAGEADPAGWWGDSFPAVEGDQIGSRLWLLKREKNTSETRLRAEEYARAALQWLIDDGIASTIAVTVTQASREMALIEIQIGRPSAADVNFRFDFVWGED